MKFVYCPVCGTKAVQKEIGDEGLMPYCPTCENPLWDYFSTSVICAVVNENREIALIRQNYVNATKYVCVAGHMKCGESAEDVAVREIYEEIGQKVEELSFVSSYPYEKKDMLMLGFMARVKKQDFILSEEVDSAEWFTLDDAPSMLREGGIAWRLVKRVGELI